MTTVANVKTSNDAHWYDPITAAPQHTVIAKSTGQPRRTTLADARKNNWVPSVTTILQILEKPALTAWKIEQAVLAVITTPRQPGEADDAFIKRVLSTEEVQHEERDAARDMGIAIHDALEQHFLGKEVPTEMLDWIMPAATAVGAHGALVACEKCLVGEGFAGKTDLILDATECWWIWDWKSTKKLPTKGAWDEHVLQASAYARAFQKLLKGDDAGKPIRTGNCYVSSVNKGEFFVAVHDDWEPTYSEGFLPLLKHWMWAKDYRPEMPAGKALPVTVQALAMPATARKTVVTEGVPAPAERRD